MSDASCPETDAPFTPAIVVELIMGDNDGVIMKQLETIATSKLMSVLVTVEPCSNAGGKAYDHLPHQDLIIYRLIASGFGDEQDQMAGVLSLMTDAMTTGKMAFEGHGTDVADAMRRAGVDLDGVPLT